MRSVLIAALVLAIPATAAAQPAMTPVAPLTQPGRAEAQPGYKSPTTAGALAAGSTALGVGMIVAALNTNDNGNTAQALGWTGLGLTVVGPSMGHFYAGENGHAIAGVALRGGGLLVATIGLASSLDFCDYDCPHEDHTAGMMAMVGGLGLYAGSAIYDMFDAPRAARRTNARTQLSVLPTALPTAHGPAPGLAVMGSF